MLKPNLNGTEGLTNLELTESLIQLLTEYGVNKIAIGESTYGNQSMTDMCFEKSGYAELSKKYCIDLLNLNRSEAREVKVKKPLILKTVKIAKEVYEFDKIINLPVMKVHYATGVSLSLKNLKGLVVKKQKRYFHEIGLDKAIVDLNNTLESHLNIIDCISCMERMGPRGGDMVDLNLLIAGKERAEVDYIGCQIMGYDLKEVKHLQYYIQVNEIHVDTIEVLGEKIKKVQYPFKKVQMDEIIPKQVTVHNHNACSACMNALLLSLQQLENDLGKKTDIFLGSRTDKEEVFEGIKIAFGNCCFYDIDFDIEIKGCPPYPLDLRNALKDNP